MTKTLKRLGLLLVVFGLLMPQLASAKKKVDQNFFEKCSAEHFSEIVTRYARILNTFLVFVGKGGLRGELNLLGPGTFFNSGEIRRI